MKRLAIPVAILILLVAFLLFFEIPRGKKQASEQRLIPGFHSASLRQFEISSPETNAKLVKDTLGVWRIKEPIETRADSVTVARILTVLDTTKIEETIDATTRPEEFGLDEQSRISFIHRKDTLFVGRNNPTGRLCYVRRSGGENVLLVPAVIRRTLNKTLYELRDKSVFRFDPKDAVQLEISRATDTVRIQKSPDGIWRLVEPENFVCEKAQVMLILNAIAHMRAESFVCEKADSIEKYGLLRPDVKAVVRLENEEEKIFLISSKQSETKRNYAENPEMGKIITVSPIVFKRLSVEPDQLRIKTLLTLSNVDSIKIEGKDTLLLKNRFGKFSIEGQTRTNQDVVQSMIREFTSIRADSLLRNVRCKRTGRRIIFFSGKDSEHFLLCGRRGEYVLIAKGEDKILYLMPGSMADWFDKSANDFLDRHFLTFDKGDINKVTLRVNDTTFQVVKKKETWQLISPCKRKLDDERVRHLVDYASDLTWKQLLPDTADIGQTNITVKIASKSGKEIVIQFTGSVASSAIFEGKKYSIDYYKIGRLRSWFEEEIR